MAKHLRSSQHMTAIYHDETFTKHALAAGLLQQLHDVGGHFQVSTWNDSALSLPAGATHFGFVLEADAHLTGGSGAFDLKAGMYFSLPGAGKVGGIGAGLLITQFEYQGLFQLGGPIESTGRLQYIDGCSDTLLISPVVRGEACLNLLVIPPGTAQTAHTHPSFRAGLICGGSGHCQLQRERVPLAAGDVFLIEPDGLHSFHTADQSLAVIAFHPDSDFGPHRDDHPMVNRTIVEGVSAAKLSPAERRICEHAP